MFFSLDWRMLAATLMASLSFAATAAHSGVGVSPSGQALPLVFEPNEGQTTVPARYLSRGANHALYLSAQESLLLLRSNRGAGETIRMRLEGADPHAVLRGETKLGGHSNYLTGNDRSQWRTNVPHFGKVRYTDVYPGIDLVYYGKEGLLEYDFVVAPGANPGRIRFRMDGARSIKLSPEGDLVLTLNNGETRHRKPVIYQDGAEGRIQVAGGYTIRGNQVSFKLGEYDRTRPLVIDPILSWSGYIGGTSADTGTSVAVDSQGNAYITGQTQSLTGFPTTNGFQTSHGGSPAVYTDAFVTKLNAAGNAILYSTYLGGNDLDLAQSITVNAAGEAYVTGHTNSTNFPTNNAYRATLSGVLDGFVVKISAGGNALLYGTYIGGSGIDYAHGIAVDSAGTMYVAGYTTSTDLPNTLLGQTLSGPTDGYVIKIPAAGNQVAFSAYIGGSNDDYILGIAIDPSSNIYVTGRTNSINVAHSGTFQSGPAGNDDAFVSKLNSSGARLYWTYIGGSENDIGRSIAVDATGAAYITGDTSSSNFPVTAGVLQPTFGGVADAFVTKLNPNGATLDFSTYLGGNGSDIGYGIAINAAGNAYVTGQTLSTNFLLVSSVKAPDQNMLDAFVTKFTPNGAKAVYSTLAGGASTEQANGIAVDTAGSAYITGVTLSNNIASSIPGGALTGTQDAFFMKFSDCSISFAPSSASPGVNGGSGAFTVNTPANCSWTAFTTSSFVQINSGSGTGPGTVNYTVSANSGAARTGSIGAETATFTISQAGSGISSTAPYNISVTPSSGSGSSSTFTARYGTARPGGAPINRAYLLINNTLNPVGACYVEYTVSSNSFRLLNDSGSTWQGPLTPGTAATAANSQCTLSAASAAATATIPTSAVSQLDLTIPLTFSSSFAGAKNVYLLAVNESQNLNSGWEAKGTWTVAPAGQVGVGTLTPSNGSGLSNRFTGTFTHTGGATQHYLGYMLFLPTPNVVNYVATGSCLVEYNRISNGMRLIDNPGTGWLGGQSGITLGTVGATLSNNQCTVSVQGATASVNGNTMTVNVTVTFKTAIGPVLGTFLQALDVNGTWTGMTQIGNWIVPGAPQTRPGPTIAGLTPATVTGSSATYTMSATSPALALMHLRISSAIVEQPACHVVYFLGSNKLNLIDAAGAALVSPTGVTPGSASTLTNGLCTLNSAGATVGASGTTANVKVPMTFNAASFGGSKNVYVNAFDTGGLLSHWVQGGVINVQ